MGSGSSIGDVGSLGKIHATVRALNMNTTMARVNHFNRLGFLGELTDPWALILIVGEVVLFSLILVTLPVHRPKNCCGKTHVNLAYNLQTIRHEGVRHMGCVENATGGVLILDRWLGNY